MRLALQARELLTPLQRVDRPLVLIEDAIVTDVTSAQAREIPSGVQTMDLGDALLVPGFIDMHIHGGAGHDVMEARPESLEAVERLLCSHGVTTYFPTTVTAPLDVTLAALAGLADAIERAGARSGRAKPVGIHLEGPFISHARP